MFPIILLKKKKKKTDIPDYCNNSKSRIDKSYDDSNLIYILVKEMEIEGLREGLSPSGQDKSI